MTQVEIRKKRFANIILGYPLTLIAVAMAVNLLVFGVNSLKVALPSTPILAGLIISALVLLANHTWLMTSTELTRLRFSIKTTPEEWEKSAQSRSDVSDEGVWELERRHNAHGNATENTVQFVLLALLVCLVSPVTLAAQFWMVGFAVGRLSHTYSYLTGIDGLRGIAMSFSLVSLYGLASYLAISLVI